MKTLDDIKDEVARENDKPNWSELLYWGSSSNGFQFPKAIDEVAKRYASQALDEAAESARVERVPNGRPGGDVDYVVNKQSILKLKDKL